MFLSRTKVLVTGVAAVALAVATPALAQDPTPRATPKRDTTKTDSSKTAPAAGSIGTSFILQMGGDQGSGVIMSGAGDATPGQARFQVRAADSSTAKSDSAKAKKDTTKKDTAKTDSSKTALRLDAAGQNGIWIMQGDFNMGSAGADDGTPAQTPPRFQVRSSTAPATPDSARADSTKKTRGSGQKPAR